MTFDITKVVEEMAIQAKESQEEFIFETIRPYCENILQLKITKKELKRILLNGTQKQEPCEDAVSRKEAINAVKDLSEHYANNQREFHPHIDFVVERLEELPSVTPQQPCEDCRFANDNSICEVCCHKYSSMFTDMRGDENE